MADCPECGGNRMVRDPSGGERPCSLCNPAAAARFEAGAYRAEVPRGPKDPPGCSRCGDDEHVVIRGAAVPCPDCLPEAHARWRADQYRPEVGREHGVQARE